MSSVFLIVDSRYQGIGVKGKAPGLVSGGEGTTHDVVVLRLHSAPALAFLLRLAAGIVIVPHRPISRTIPQTDMQRDDLCRL